jgi:PadR family transcriptional regulator, regulatory protein AphA
VNVRTLCLGYLSLQEASGYEIKKDFEDGMFCHFMEASYGSIYPSLNQLAAEGKVDVREEEQSGKPDKKVYSITPSGVAALTSELGVLPARDKFKSEFLFIMLLQHYVGPSHRIAVIEKQLVDLKADLASIDECRMESGDNPASEFVLGYGEAVLTASVTYLEQKLAEMSATHAKAAAE